MAVLKQPGDAVKRDEPIYQMETDKAVMDVESPYEGTLVEWLAAVDTILPIGGEVARMEVAAGVEEMSVHGTAATASAPASATVAEADGGGRSRGIPPRTRAYAREKGVSDDVLGTVPAAGAKLMPDDVDAYLAGRAAQAPAAIANDKYTEEEMGPKQRLLSSRLVRGTQLVVPGTISVVANWGPIERLRTRMKAGGSEFQPSAFTLFAYAVARAMPAHPKFRSTLIGDSTVRTYKHASLGIAVALPGDLLVVAVVDEADTLDWKAFAATCRERISHARAGHDQAHEGVTLSLTNMQAHGLRDAVPVVVPPSVGTLFLGESFNALDPSTDSVKMQRVVNLGLTFDHRLINGVGAAEFLNDVRTHLETIDSLAV